MCTRKTFLLHYVLDVEIKWPSPLYDRDTKNKADELDRLHASMIEKVVTASNTAKLQILTLVPDSWSRNYCSEYFYLIWSARELKQRKGILAQTSQKKAKAMTQETTGSCFLWGWWIQQTAFPGKGLCKDTKMCSQTKGVSYVQSPWIVCCIQRKKPRCENHIFQFSQYEWETPDFRARLLPILKISRFWKI